MLEPRQPDGQSDMTKPSQPLQQQHRLVFPRELFLRAVCAIYGAAFASIGQQIRGLYGEDGLEPVDVFLQRLKQRDERLRSASPFEATVIYPTAVWLHEELEWSPSFTMQVIALLGLTVSLLGVCHPRWRTIVPLAVVWLCYLSIVQCGQTFMRFQWDSFLLEVGFLSIWLAPWWQTEDDTFESPAAVVWTLRFLFFKFMFMSGAVKIQSECPTWLGLTALEYHFATQPLPLPLSWYAHQLPPSLLRLGVAATLLFEGPWAFFIMVPSLTIRRFSAVMQILLQLMIMLTGNYNFFNLLTVVMAVATLDVRETLQRDQPESPSLQKPRVVPRVIAGLHTMSITFYHRVNSSLITLAAAMAYCVYTFNKVFSIGLDGSRQQVASWEGFFASLWIRFEPTVAETQAWIARVLPVSIIVSAVIIFSAATWQLARVWVNLTPSTVPRRRNRVISTVYLIVSTMVSAWVFCSSALTLSILDRPFQHSLPPFVFEVYDSSSPWRITSAYGLFRTMTGVGTYEHGGVQTTVVARPEIILEGTDDGGATWKAYHFKHKPGDIDVAPTLNVPFQPRLDWQMWFASLSTYQDTPWVIHLVDKLLKQSPDVSRLLDSTRNPFPDSPPQAVRAQLYYYDFTRLETPWSKAIPTAVYVNDTSDKRWWTRTFYKEYIPALEQGNPSLAAFVQHHFGRDPAVSRPPSDCVVTNPSSFSSWVCVVLQHLVDQPVAAAIAIVVVVLSCSQCVAMLGSTTQSPKQKIE